MTRTSQTNPIQIAVVQPSRECGRIGITLCPGKFQPDAMTGGWARDLESDLDAIVSWGASAVVTLVEDHELSELKVAHMGEAVRRMHMDWYHSPIRDFDIPCVMFERQWKSAGKEIRWRLANGFDILVHCKGGLGRAGMIAAKLLVEFGIDPATAIARVRDVRPGAIETEAQENYIMRQGAVEKAAADISMDACRDRAVGALVGLAVGDAVGTTLEFATRDSYEPLTDMVGGGPFNLEAGQWTDDSSMALALADSLISHNGFNARDLMGRFQEWMEDGRYSSTGTCFDIGVTTHAAIQRWQSTGDPIAGSTDQFSAGNGSIMRLAPVAIRYWRNHPRLDDVARRQSETTHATIACLDACSVMAHMLAKLISGSQALHYEGSIANVSDRRIRQVAAGSWRGRPRSSIRGSGYVVESLEAALWSVGRTGNFEQAVLTAANLGEDADTTAAIAGQFAGALYGLSAIPRKWLAQLAKSDQIIAMGNALFDAGYRADAAFHPLFLLDTAPPLAPLA